MSEQPFPDAANDTLLVFQGIHARHLPTVQQVVHILQKALLANLGVGQQEHHWLALYTRHMVKFLHHSILLPSDHWANARLGVCDNV